MSSTRDELVQFESEKAATTGVRSACPLALGQAGDQEQIPERLPAARGVPRSILAQRFDCLGDRQRSGTNPALVSVGPGDPSRVSTQIASGCLRSLGIPVMVWRNASIDDRTQCARTDSAVWDESVARSEFRPMTLLSGIATAKVWTRPLRLRGSCLQRAFAGHGRRGADATAADQAPAARAPYRTSRATSAPCLPR